jgi:cysteinyl-tRNA synthetase
MRDITLHDTRTGKLLALEPRDLGQVGIYACGPTVYSRIHIGNARPFVVFNLLKRFLEHEGYDTTLVMNVTDVNDKIYNAARPDPQSSDPARRAGRPSAELAAEMTALYIADTDALELGRPDHEPLASETMGAIVAYIRELIDSGHAYVVEYGGEGDGGGCGRRWDVTAFICRCHRRHLSGRTTSGQCSAPHRSACRRRATARSRTTDRRCRGGP